MMTTKQTVLLTGGAGYIGSHTAVALAEAGYEPVILDNFSSSQPSVLGRLEKIMARRITCERGDVRDSNWVRDVLVSHRINAVIHFAGYRAISESVTNPLKYYRNNVGGTVSLLDAMHATNCRFIVFFQQCDGLWQSINVTSHRGFCKATGQSLWLDEGSMRRPASQYLQV